MTFIEISLQPEQIKPIPKTLNFGSDFSSRMYTQKYNRAKGWHDATIGPYQPLQLDPATAVLHYAQEIFEGTKAYRRPDGRINLFRPWENTRRFNESAIRMSMPQVDAEEHLAAIVRLVELEHEWVPEPPAALYIRPFMFASKAGLGVHASDQYMHVIIVGPVGSYFPQGFAPVPVYISDKYRRAAMGGTGAAKTGGNYAASLLVTEEAKAKGYSQVLWLDATEGRYVEEVGAMNICFVYEDKKIVTPPLRGTILAGITRDSVLRMAPDLGYEVAEEMIDVHEMLADVRSGKVTEVFGCGTAAVIAPVGRFGYLGEDYVINQNESGPVATALYQRLTDIQYGRVADPYGWTMLIEANGNGQ
jgi:branched-chain amino acid aminotransferase